MSQHFTVSARAMCASAFRVAAWFAGLWSLCALQACGLGDVGPDYGALRQWRASVDRADAAVDAVPSPETASVEETTPDVDTAAETAAATDGASVSDAADGADVAPPADAVMPDADAIADAADVSSGADAVPGADATADTADGAPDVAPPACQTATDCQDGNACMTGKTCSGGSCTAGSAASCDDGNVCTDDSCVASAGCIQVANAGPCDDGSACTAGDACSGAKCGHSQVLDCDDKKVCTIDFCDPKAGCKYSSASGYCTDGDACTIGDGCSNGTCVAGSPANCAPSTACSLSVCDKVKGCKLIPQADGMACGGASFCHAGSCVAPWANRVAIGTLHACALNAAGAVSCWGANMFGQLGNDGPFASDAPVPANLETAGTVRCGSGHCCALTGPTGAHTVACWGLDNYLQTGDPKGGFNVKPATIPLAAAVTDVVAGQEHSCALATTGQTYCWGTNDNHQLGTADPGSGTATPQLVGGVPVFVSIVAGMQNTCGRDASGAVWCWGSLAGTWGGLGSAAAAPTPLSGLGAVTDMAVGETHACATLLAGGAVCWGTNATGELGNGNTGAGYSGPGNVVLSAPVRAWAAGRSHTCALTDQGEVWCWGSHAYGQLGVGMALGASNASWIPVKIPDFQAVALAAIDDRTCAVRTDGAVLCWGKIPYGSTSFVPVPVPGTAP